MSIPHQYEHLPRMPLVAKCGPEHDCRVLAWALKPANLHVPSDRTNGELLYISLTGYHPLVRGFWAAIVDGKQQNLDLPYEREFRAHTGEMKKYTAYHTAHRPDGKGVYDTFWNDTPLEFAGSYAHLAMVHTSMFSPTQGQWALHLSADNGSANFALAHMQLDHILTLPVLKDWVPQLWELGLKHGLIVPLPSHNCVAWLIQPDEAKWGQITTSIYAPGRSFQVVTIAAAKLAEPAKDGETDDDEIVNIDTEQEETDDE